MIVRVSCRMMSRACIRFGKKAGARGIIRVLIIVISSDNRGRLEHKSVVKTCVGTKTELLVQVKVEDESVLKLVGG